MSCLLCLPLQVNYFIMMINNCNRDLDSVLNRLCESTLYFPFNNLGMLEI